MTDPVAPAYAAAVANWARSADEGVIVVRNGFAGLVKTSHIASECHSFEADDNREIFRNRDAIIAQTDRNHRLPGILRLQPPILAFRRACKLVWR